MSFGNIARSLAAASIVALALAVTAPDGGAQQPAGAIDGAAIDAAFGDIDSDGPGCAVGVVRDGALAYAEGYGMANLDYGLPITPTSNFYLGSVSKQFTAAAIAHAARAGHLSLDDPIRKWFPEIPEYERPVTVRHLVHHTSGVRDYLGLGNLAGWRFEDIHTDEETLALIARQRAGNFPAGDEYLYSNSGYFLLSELIERATDMSLREYMDEHFFGPLGMEGTRFNDEDARLDPMDERVIGYEAANGGYEMAHPWNYDKVGAGGLYSNIEDLARWDRNWYTEEVGGDGFTRQLSERGVLNDGTGIDYAFGLSHGDYRGLEMMQHGGALAGFRASVARFPTEETTVLVLCNFPTSDPDARSQRVADAVLADALAPVAEEEEASVPEAVELAAEELDAFVGHWRASMGIEVEIVREGDELYFLQSGNRSPLLVAAPDRLLLTQSDVDMRLENLVDGRYQSMSVTQRGNAFTAERFTPGEAPPDYGDLYGRYYAEELDTTYEILEDDGGLMLEITPWRRGEMRRLGRDAFVAPGMRIAIERDETGAVTGFTIDAGRVRGITFRRTDG